jgi:Transglutaminase-like superfamily
VKNTFLNLSRSAFRILLLLGLLEIAMMTTEIGTEPAARAAEIRGVWVTSDASVDTSSVKSIVQGLIKKGMSGQEKALAIFNWYRRVIYPHNYLARDRRDVLRQINSYGNTLCGSHAANMGWLMRAAGFKTRCTFIHGGGHTFVDVWYDDAWHSLDPETDFAVWSRGKKPHLINMDELKADPTLLENPEKEGRARPWLFKAMKFPWTSRKKMADYCDDRKNKSSKAAMQWSSSVLKGESIKDYFVNGVKSVKYSKDNAAYGGHVSDPDLMKINLKPGETLIRRWSNEGRGKYIRGQGFGGYPAHLLYGGGADENDVEIFKYVEPYRQDSYGLPALPVNRCYRYSGNGHQIWSPDLAAGQLQSAPGVQLKNLLYDRKSGLLHPQDAAKPGVILIAVRSSYALVWAEISALWKRDAASSIKISTRVGKKAWKEAWTCPQAATEQISAAIGKAVNGLYNYQLKIELQAGAQAQDVGLKALKTDHTFVNNWLALPFLKPGRNKIRVRLENPDVLKKNLKLFVEYKWQEGPDWKISRSVKKQVTESPFEFTIETKGPKFPRMKELLLSCETD